ncbi:4Fe-4S binding protein [Gemmiger sp.]|uniref:4Fe-4S binding protein n=1 Tax=Gemmiger sp. TaxID=2049027 RepID=UPI0039C61852
MVGAPPRGRRRCADRVRVRAGHQHTGLLEKTASACIGCHACESRCPFGVKIAERMKKTAALFGR